MSEAHGVVAEWDFLIGFPLDEARQILEEEAVSYKLQFTAAPSKVSSQEDAFVIAVRDGDPLVIICASPNWGVN